MSFPPNRDRKEYDIRLLGHFTGLEVEFQTRNNEHLIGMLSNHNSEIGTFTFTNLRKIDGNHWAMKQIYTYADFFGKFIATANMDFRPSGNSGQTAAEEELNSVLTDKETRLVKIESTDVSGIINNDPLEIIVNPDIKNLQYESIDFSFTLDQDEFETVISNDVTRITSPNDHSLNEVIETLSSRQLISMVVLPFSIDNRNEPMEFIIFGCDKGSFIFTVNQEVMKRLKAILESKEITKVLHDSAITTARLRHLFDIDIENVDDTAVLNTHYILKHNKDNRKSDQFLNRFRSYSSCVKSFLGIKLPWEPYVGFYQRCGKGKLLAAELDDTGRGYARGLAMLLPELRMEILKHIVIPLVAKQFTYSNVVKYASDLEYTELRNGNLISPHNLSNADWGNSDEFNLSITATISELLLKKFKLFNRIRKPLTRDSCTQTDPMLVGQSTRRTFSPSYSRVLAHINSSRSSTVSPCDSSDESLVKTTIQSSASSSSSSTIKSNGHCNGNDKKLLRIDKNHPQLSENTNDDIDWSLARLSKLSSSSDSWGIKHPDIIPAGFNR
ncbi:uncharacterized protein LOC128393041 [Panonychus citri]|uniref:uncharacterized protein LOC128393041 n=1 Tax=Panonychus citri TaxID=50023 RepID=UPI002306EB72|nr:uncharacterized protein LOC128393041 [Panonychus citri]